LYLLCRNGMILFGKDQWLLTSLVSDPPGEPRTQRVFERSKRSA
jgi:hypothetical protein